MAYNLSAVENGITTIIGGKIFALNSHDEIQTWDTQSTLSIGMKSYIDHSITNSNVKVTTQLSYLNGTVQVNGTNFNFTSQPGGYFEVPNITIYGIPGDTF